MRFRLTPSYASLAFLLAMFAGGCRPTPPPGYGPVRVLAVFNLTGSQSELDVAAYNGARLAMQQINKNGGVLGRDLELVPVDTGSNKADAIADVEQALKTEAGIVAGIGYCDSAFANEVGGLFQKEHMPFVSPGATDPKLPARVGNEMFLAAYGDDAQAQAMAEFAKTKLKKGRIAVWMNDHQEYTVAVATYFSEAFQAHGGHVETHTKRKGESNFMHFIRSIKTTDPPVDAIYGATMPAQAVAFVSQVRAAGIDVPLLSGDGWDEEPLIALSKEKNLSGIYFTTHRFLDVETSTMKAFVSAYEAENGQPPTNAFAALGYDTVGLVANAIRRAGSAQPDAIRAALAKTTDYEGIVGPITYRNGSRVPIKPVSVVEVDGGEESAVWTTTPSDSRH